MLTLSTLTTKKFFEKAGQMIVDLTRRSVSFLNVKQRSGDVYIVEKELEMRPDLVAYSFLKDTSVTCYLMKYNDVSNPFSVHEGMVWRIPASDELRKMGAEPMDIASKRSRDNSNIIKPKSKLDQKRIDYLKNKGALAVPTNVALDDSVKVVNGRIIFGADVTSVKKEDCPEPLSRARLKETLLKNKIFGQ